MGRVKESFIEFGKKWSFKKHKKAYSFIIAAIFILTLVAVWFFRTPTGELAQYSFFKSFNPIPEEHVIEVYSGGIKIKEYIGYYRVEKYQSYYTILCETTNERIDVYGADMVIVNEMKQWEKSKTSQDNVLED